MWLPRSLVGILSPGCCRSGRASAVTDPITPSVKCPLSWIGMVFMRGHLNGYVMHLLLFIGKRAVGNIL